MLFLKKKTSVFRAARVVDMLTYRVWTCVGRTGAAEDECSTEQGSGCLFIIPPRTAPHCSFVLCHLETNTLARASFHQRPQTHVKKKNVFVHLISIKHPHLLIWTGFMRIKWGITNMKRIYYLANVVNDYILFGKLCLTQKRCSFRSKPVSVQEK